MAFFHLGNTRKRRGFSGLPIAASCGGRPPPRSAGVARKTAAYGAFLGIALLSLCGCGGEAGVEYVEGIVLFNGEPLADAAVAFSPVQPGEGLPAVGKTGPDGKFTLTVVPPGNRRPGTGTAKGDYLVSISKQIVEWPLPPPDARPDAMGIIKNPPPKVTFITPRHYSECKSSGLSATIVAGRNQPTFQLSSE